MDEVNYRAYIDDVIIASNTKKDHLNHLEETFSYFHDIGLALSLKNSFCGFLLTLILPHATISAYDYSHQHDTRL